MHNKAENMTIPGADFEFSITAAVNPTLTGHFPSAAEALWGRDLEGMEFSAGFPSGEWGELDGDCEGKEGTRK